MQPITCKKGLGYEVDVKKRNMVTARQIVYSFFILFVKRAIHYSYCL